MPRVIERTVYQFSELSDSAKETARSKYREGNHHDEWWGSVYEDAVTAGALLGIEIGTYAVKLHNGKTRDATDISFSGFCSQGDGACYQGRYRPVKDPVAGLATHVGEGHELFALARELVVLQATSRLTTRYFLEAQITAIGYYNHSGTMSCDVTFVDETDGESPPEHLEKELTGILRRFADWIYEQLKTEDEYLTCDEHVDERLSDDEFDEDGHIV